MHRCAGEKRAMLKLVSPVGIAPVFSICALVGENPSLVEAAIASTPSESLKDFVLLGPQTLAPAARRRGGIKHLAIDLAAENAAENALAARAFLGSLPNGCFILPVDETGSDFVSLLGEGNWIVAPVSSPEISRRLTDNYSFFELCRELSIPIPPTLSIASAESADFDELGRRLGLPLVLKPTRTSAPAGSAVIHTRSEFERKVLYNDAYRYAPLVAQTYAPGQDVGLSALAVEGDIRHHVLGLPEKHQIRFYQDERMLAHARRLIGATGYSGFLRMDFRFRPNGGVEALEFSAGLPATLGASTWGGLNFIRAAFELARGGASKEPACLQQGAAPRGRLDALKAAALGFLRGKEFRPDQRRIVNHGLLLRAWG
jgi:hypothetical protein